jgi:hypothetical protein
MRIRAHLALAALLGAVVLLTAAGTATASRSTELRAPEEPVKFSGQLTFNGSELEAVKGITCDVTLLRTILRSIPKIPGTSFGRITSIALDRGTEAEPHCASTQPFLGLEFLQESGRAAPTSEDRRGTIISDLSRSPGALWRLIYDGFQGTLPEISGFSYHIPGFSFQWRVFNGIILIECLYEGNIFGLLTISRRVVTSNEHFLERTRLLRRSGSAFCPMNATFGGTIRPPSITIALL